MPYIGNPIYQSAFVVDQFNGNGSTTAFTMSVAPAGVTNVLVAVSGVLQDPSTYGVVGNTITFSAAPPSGTGNISCRYLGVPASGVTTTAYRTVTEFTATASQTTFTPPSYNVGFINVYLNGVLLGSADYTATNGTTVVLATGASAGNLLTVESFRIESVANAIPNAVGAVTSSNIQSGVTINFADGSASTPSITNDGDTNTGIFFPAADTIAFSEGGVESMRIDSAGDVGIGNASPYAKLQTYQSSSTLPVQYAYRGIQGNDVSLPTTYGFPYLQIGRAEFRANSLQTIGFGYLGADGNNPPAEIGYLTTSTSGETIGDLVFATRSVTTNTAASERMRINSSGIVTMPYVPAFHVSQSASSSGFAANSVANWNIVTTNNGGHFKTTAGTGQNQRFIAPVAGIYHFNCLMLSNQNTQLFFSIRVNGSNVNGTNIETYTGSQYQSVTSTATVSLAVNDFVDILVGSNPGYGSAYANFNGFLIG